MAQPYKRVGFDLRHEESTGQRYYFCPYTGETLYDPDGVGLDNLSRLGSYWVEPEKSRVEFRGMLRQLCSERREVAVSPSVGRLSQEQAALILTKLGRRVLAQRRVRHAAGQRYEKRQDAESGFYYYYDKLSQVSQWHKPLVLCSPFWDLPVLRDSKEAESLVAKDGKVGVPTTTKYGDLWGRTPETKAYTRAKFSQGPVFRLEGHFTRTRRIDTNLLMRDKPFAGQRVVRRFSDIDTATADLGDAVVHEDKYVRTEVHLDPYMLLRAQYHRGADAIMRTMAKHPHHRLLQQFGFAQLAKYPYSGTAEGAASTRSVSVMNLCLKTMESADAGMICRALETLAVVADEYVNRAVMMRKGTLPAILKLLKQIKRDRQTFKLDNEESVIETVSIPHVTYARLGIKIISMLAYDDAHRVSVTEQALAPVMHAMKVCADDPEVLVEGLKALQNFVFLNEDCHLFCTKHKALKLVQRLIEQFATDPEVVAFAKRTVQALSRDGWRATGNV